MLRIDLLPYIYWSIDLLGFICEFSFLFSSSKRYTLICSQNPQVDLEDDHLNFTAEGCGGRGRNTYHFDVNFYLDIKSKVCERKI